MTPAVPIVGLVTLVIMLAGQALIASLIGAVILRVAVTAFNRLAGKSAPPPSAKIPIAEPVGPAIPRRPTDSPYQAPAAYVAPTQVLTRGVVIPSFGKAFLTCLAANGFNLLLGLLIGIGIGVIAEMEDSDLDQFGTELVWQIAIAAMSMMGLVGAIKFIFPTTFLRSLAISGIFLLLVIAILILIGIAVWLLSSVRNGLG